tara:strand:+ start:734 stop:910 length:177 start_codon:yes stop_codon:yes gene_type:complete
MVPRYLEEQMRYFKKPNGRIVTYDPQTHDIDSFEERFIECDINGKPKPKPKPKKKEDK